MFQPSTLQFSRGRISIWDYKNGTLFGHTDYPIWAVYSKGNFLKGNNGYDRFQRSSGVNYDYGAGGFNERCKSESLWSDVKAACQHPLQRMWHSFTENTSSLMMNRLGLTKPKSSAIVVTRHGILLENANPRNQDSRRRDAWNTGNKEKDNGRRSGKQEDSKALVTLDGECVDWTSHSEDEQENYAFMACNSSGNWPTCADIKTLMVACCFWRNVKMRDKKNKVLFTDFECLVLFSEFKLPDENQVLLRIPRQNNMYSFNPENIVPSGGLACLIENATIDESNKWHRKIAFYFMDNQLLFRCRFPKRYLYNNNP
ncbi:hypothetical protein Tco_1017907 [Tanacetum coccineum]|uniref:Uncharacterized protein n=1 Tax=Tanacetum coccineum TaxID=301880 RepID=A0ABQ5FVF1_9ASTR